VQNHHFSQLGSLLHGQKHTAAMADQAASSGAKEAETILFGGCGSIIMTLPHKRITHIMLYTQCSTALDTCDAFAQQSYSLHTSNQIAPLGGLGQFMNDPSKSGPPHLVM
jgi:hypothetical protein